MMPVRNNANSDARYHRMAKSDDGYIDSQFQARPVKVPYKAIFIATCMFVAGTLLIMMGVMLLTGYIDTKYSDRTWPMLILGSLMFIPGAYHVRLAYYAWRGYSGYSYDDIPGYD